MKYLEFLALVLLTAVSAGCAADFKGHGPPNPCRPGYTLWLAECVSDFEYARILGVRVETGKDAGP